MAAALGLNLVLEMHAGGARAGELARRARDRERCAEASVGVDEERQRGRAADAAHVLADVVEARDPEVGQPERGVRDAGAGQVDRAEAGFLGEQRAVGIDRAGDLQRALGLDGVTQPPARGSFRHSDMIHRVMKRIVRSLSVLFVAGFAGFAHASECSSLASMRWLLGDWLAEGDKTTWRETWTEIGPDTWEGRGIEVAKAESGKQSAEDLRLVEMGGSVFYLAKVTHNELPIPFRLVECGDDRLVFANPAHDFPRRLDYQRQPDGRLQVRVSDGADKGFTLDFARQPTASADSAASSQPRTPASRRW